MGANRTHPHRLFTPWMVKRQFQLANAPLQFAVHGGFGDVGGKIGSRTNRGQRRVPPCLPSKRRSDFHPMHHLYDKLTGMCRRCGWRKGDTLDA